MARNKYDKPRVFCIGWHKTGTTTMGIALLELGYTVLGCRLDMAKPLMSGDKETPIQLAGNFDALQDIPWAGLFKELDEAYPGSKFILTIRDEDSWMNSATKHFKDKFCLLHQYHYGVDVLIGNESIYRRKFRQHYEEVYRYFLNRPEDLLTIDFAIGEGWEKLCSFLDEPIPSKPFPYGNKGKHNYNWRDRVKDFMRKCIPVSIRNKRVEILENKGLHYGRNRFNNYEENRRNIESKT